MRKRREKEERFTLIEVLVVISIVAVLMTILLPALKTAREKGRSITCVGQLKQLGYAFHSYANDRADFFPLGSTDVPLGSWCFLLADYLNIAWEPANTYPSSGPAIFRCPTANPCDITEALRTTPLYNLGYGYNRYLYDPAYAVRRTKVSQPSFCLLAADLCYVTGAYTIETDMCGYVNARLKNINSFNHVSPSPYFSYRHAKALNALFTDGHIEGKREGANRFPHGIYLCENPKVFFE